jgi:aspartyl-tRNA(Asn)/glutamyl-tRNA(Gln) amidotransferase subunit A
LVKTAGEAKFLSDFTAAACEIALPRFNRSFATMSSLPAALSMAEWQALASRDAGEAAREVARRIRAILPDDQQRAVFATLTSQTEIANTFARVAGTIAPLAGVPYVLKDLFFTAGQPLLAGSRFPTGVLPIKPRDSKLPHSLRGMGSVLVAKTHLHEFAYGLTGENPHYGDCQHPRFPDRTSGGSSSGSAVAVAAGVVPLGVGTDTGGSIRVPAAFCGLYGLRLSPKDTFIEDAFPLAPSFDTAGWFTRLPADMQLVNRFIVGKPVAATRELRGCFLDFGALGLPAEAEVSTAFLRAARTFAPAADAATAGPLVRAFEGCAEAYSILQSTEAFAVHEAWLDRHRELYGADVWARIDRGRRWTPAQLASAHATWQAVRAIWQSYFLTFDFLILPATPFPALAKADCTLENRNRLLQLNTPASLGGLPVLTVPVTLPSGLSTGLQIVVNSPLSPVVDWVLRRAIAEKPAGSAPPHV